MRLWHKDLLCVLPKQQLVSQWRECCAIARTIAVIGTPNHILVNRIMDYPISHFYAYAHLVIEEMNKRGFAITVTAYAKFEEYIFKIVDKSDVEQNEPSFETLFYNWHNDRYLWQCFYNLEEKHDCGAITDEEWQQIEELATFYV